MCGERYRGAAVTAERGVMCGICGTALKPTTPAPGRDDLFEQHECLIESELRRRYWSPLGDRRERAVPCWICQTPTWALDGLCDPCAERRHLDP